MDSRIVFASWVQQLVSRRRNRRTVEMMHNARILWLPVGWLAVVLITAVGLSGAAQGDEIAIAPPDTPHNGFATEIVFGWEFTPNQNIFVTALGWFDHERDGFLNGRHEVGMFRVSDQSLLASALIDSTSALEGDYRYESVGPTLLTAGQKYVVAGFDPLDADDRYPVGVTLANMNLDPVLTFHQEIGHPAASLVYPVDLPDGTEPWIMPANFQFTVVPEPTSLMLVVGGLLGVLAIRRLSVRGHAKP